MQFLPNLYPQLPVARFEAAMRNGNDVNKFGFGRVDDGFGMELIIHSPDSLLANQPEAQRYELDREAGRGE